MIHVYAFVEQLVELPAVNGLDGASLERLRVEDVDAVFSRRSDETSRETLRRDALAHGTVVESLAPHAAAVAPVRFGELLADDLALASSLRERLPALRRAFDRVRDCVEVAVRVDDRTRPVGVPAASGTGYLRARADEESRRQATTEALHRRLDAVARESQVQHRPFSASYLVSRGRLHEVRAAVDEFGAAHHDLTVVCTGPWAPFSFVEEAA